MRRRHVTLDRDSQAETLITCVVSLQASAEVGSAGVSSGNSAVRGDDNNSIGELSLGGDSDI